MTAALNLRIFRSALFACAMAGMLFMQAVMALQDSSVVKLSDLPAEARNTYQLIKQGGPYPYPRDGVVFSNYEKQLPKKPRGYYHEYTVKTPGARNRGARRIVCGEVTECYYTADHYQSFQRIRE